MTIGKFFSLRRNKNAISKDLCITPLNHSSNLNEEFSSSTSSKSSVNSPSITSASTSTTTTPKTLSRSSSIHSESGKKPVSLSLLSPSRKFTLIPKFITLQSSPQIQSYKAPPVTLRITCFPEHTPGGIICMPFRVLINSDATYDELLQAVLSSSRNGQWGCRLVGTEDLSLKNLSLFKTRVPLAALRSSTNGQRVFPLLVCRNYQLQKLDNHTTGQVGDWFSNMFEENEVQLLVRIVDPDMMTVHIDIKEPQSVSVLEAVLTLPRFGNIQHAKLAFRKYDVHSAIGSLLTNSTYTVNAIDRKSGVEQLLSDHTILQDIGALLESQQSLWDCELIIRISKRPSLQRRKSMPAREWSIEISSRGRKVRPWSITLAHHGSTRSISTIAEV